MGLHDHPEACQHTVAWCSHCNVAYCTVCGAQWEQVPLPGLVAQLPARAYGPPEALRGAFPTEPEAEHVHATEGP